MADQKNPKLAPSEQAALAAKSDPTLNPDKDPRNTSATDKARPDQLGGEQAGIPETVPSVDQDAALSDKIDKIPEASAFQDRAAKDQLGDGKPLKAEKTADEDQSKDVVERSQGAKAIVAGEQNPASSSLQDKAKISEQAFLADEDGKTTLVWRCGPEIPLGQFFILEVNDHTYTFEEGKPLPVDDKDVDDLLEIANENDYYTIEKA